MNTISWVFLTELLIVPGVWILVCAWTDQFADKKAIESLTHKNIVEKYSPEKPVEQSL